MALADQMLTNSIKGQGAHLYFMRFARSRSPVKIGRANDPVSRLKTLQVALPYRLKLLGTLDGCGDYEIAFHCHLSKFRMLGEWFKWSPLVEATVGLALEGGDWKDAIALKEAPITGPDDWRIGSPLYAGNPNYPQFQ